MITMFVHVEGLDLAGKTSVCEALVDQLPGPISLQKDCVSGDMQWLEQAEMRKSSENLELCDIGEIFLSAAKRDIDSVKGRACNILQESLLPLRLSAYFGSRGFTRLSSEFEIIVEKISNKYNFHSYFLAAGIEERKKRLQLRRSKGEKITSDDLLIETNPEQFLKNEQALWLLSVKHFGSVRVTTDGRTIAQVSDAIAFQTRRNFEG